MSTYALSDIHGCLNLFNAVMDTLGPDDKLYFLGDAIDRGSSGWEIMKKLLDDPRVVYLKGNHEDMFLQCWGNYNSHPIEDVGYDDATWLWYQNGGYNTEQNFVNDPISEEEKARYINKLKNAPFACVYHSPYHSFDVILTHAGCNYKNFNNLTEQDAIWDRNHYRNNYWDGDDNTIIVHGHTPIPILVEDQEQFARFYDRPFHAPENLEGAYWYADGHKCCIDCGTVFTGMTVLLNLDTWEERVFMED